MAPRNEAVTASARRLGRLFAVYWPLVRLVNAAGLAASMLMALTLLRGGRLSPGDIMITFLYCQRIYAPVIELSRYGTMIAQAGASLARVFALRPAAPEDQPGRETIQVAGPPEIELEAVTMARGDDRVLSDVSLTIPAGSLTALVGESGAGKSSLMRALLGLEMICGGRILVDGQDLASDPAALRGTARASFQQSLLFDRSLWANLVYGNPQAAPQLVHEVARALGIDGILDLRGGAFEVGAAGRNLSGGEGRRVSLARALVGGGPLYFVDEPTAELDEASRRKVLDAICRLKGQATVVVCTHDRELADVTDVRVYLEKGWLVSRVVGGQE